MSKIYPFLDLAKVNEPYMEELQEATQRVVRSGRYIGGPEVSDFEAELADYIGVPHAVGVSNGLDALRLILRAWIVLGRLKAGDKVLVAANTYIASILAITDAGLTPVIIDPDVHTMNISADGISCALDADPDIKGVMIVHLYGRVTWDAEISDLIERYNLLVIEDCAQSIGARATIPGLSKLTDRAGGLGHAAAFSFYPTKNTGALGDAGAVTTHDKELAETVRALANYGSDRRYHNIYAGYNCRLDPMQAAMLRVKLPHNDAENRERVAKAHIYNRLLKNDAISLPALPGSADECVWHQYVIRVKDGKRDLLQRLLSERGVGTDIHYAVPPHLQPCYTTLPHGNLPVTEALADEVLSLPIARGTTEQDVKEICNIINNIDFK